MLGGVIRASCFPGRNWRKAHRLVAEKADKGVDADTLVRFGYDRVVNKFEDAAWIKGLRSISRAVMSGLRSTVRVE